MLINIIIAAISYFIGYIYGRVKERRQFGFGALTRQLKDMDRKKK
jgi:hypothetical protein